MLSREASAEPGKWRTERAPYQRGIMDAFSDPRVERVVVMSSAQIGKSECLLNVLGYYIDQDPAPILLMQPTIRDAEEFSKLRVSTMLRDTPRLRNAVKDPRSRDSGNTLLMKEFPGGGLYLAGANAPSAIAGRPIRVVLRDERDRFPASAGTEGDPGAISDKRTSTFWNRKLGDWSTPTLKGYSQIESLYLEGDQRRYFVPCPDCGEFQTLSWPNLKWDEGKPETAYYCCPACGAAIPESQKYRMLARGEWRPGAPLARIASFHLNALYSPWARWGDLAAEWISAQQDMTKLQVFVNTVLGESWEDRGGGLDPESMFANRRESYPAPVPMAAGMLTAGVDVQHDRIEIVVRAWAGAEESFFVERVVLMGDPTTDALWSDLDAVLFDREWRHESGAMLKIFATAIDSGDNTERVMRYCAPRYRRRVFCVKGAANPAAPFMPKRPTRNNKHHCPLFMLGVNQAKALIYGRLKITGGLDFNRPCAYRYRWNLSADRDYFDQLTAEKAERKYLNRLWVMVYTCPAHKRNEVLDCEVYALAALNLSNQRPRLAALAAKMAGPIVEHETYAKFVADVSERSEKPAPDVANDADTEQEPAPAPHKPAPPRKQSPWVRGRNGGSGWRIK
jgi:phage terminase large subunit GpA-like protein